MRTTMRSESTLVPPVTAERSPPLSRMTGADSPVMADSSTEAMPSMTSPSPGMSCAGLDDDAVALAQRATRRPRSSRPSTSRRAVVSLRILRSVAACALPRPSATASAKLANSTVNQSQSVTAPVNQSGGRLGGADDEVADDQQRGQHAADLDHEHDRVLGHHARARACGSCRRPPGRRIARSNRRRACALDVMTSEHLSVAGPGSARRSGPSESAGKKVSAPTITITPTSSAENSGAVGGERARAGRHRLLVDHRAGDRQRGDDHQEAAGQHGRGRA